VLLVQIASVLLSILVIYGAIFLLVGLHAPSVDSDNHAFHVRCCDVNESTVRVYRAGFIAGSGGPYDDDASHVDYPLNDSRLSPRLRSIVSNSTDLAALDAHAECTDDEAAPLAEGWFRIDCMGMTYGPDFIVARTDVAPPGEFFCLGWNECPRSLSRLVVKMVISMCLGVLWGAIPFVLVITIWACCLPRASRAHVHDTIEPPAFYTS